MIARKARHQPWRDESGHLYITIPAALASGAHQQGEEAELFAYLVARALDAKGSGRVDKLALAREIQHAYKGGKVHRLFERPGGRRYWASEGPTLRLHGQAAILESFSCELLRSDMALTLSVAHLDTRPRRNAAMLAAVLAGQTDPRSAEFIQRFARVDRKTWNAWQADPVIRRRILRKLNNWAEM